MHYLQGLTPSRLVHAVPDVSLTEARRIFSAIHRRDCLPTVVRGVRRTSLEATRATGFLPAMAVRDVARSRLDPFVKFSLEASGGETIETVRIPLEKEGRFSVCVSSQAGCGLGCLFCATGHMGFRRNLDTWEIVEQVRVVRRSLNLQQKQRVHGIVFQGMGEPLANLDHVLEAIRVVCEPSGFAVDQRAVTVCTAGLPAGIRRLAQEAPNARLGISIGSTRNEVRAMLMPIERTFPLAEVLDAAAEHARRTRIDPMWAMMLIDGANDSEEEAGNLAALAHEFRQKSGRRPRLSILDYNPISAEGARDFAPARPERVAAFRRVLSEAGLPSHRRYSGGSDIAAACGQLAGAVMDADPHRSAYVRACVEPPG